MWHSLQLKVILCCCLIMGSYEISLADDMFIATSSTFRLNKKTIQSFVKEAKAGSAEAAFKLYQHYDFVDLDQRNGEKWLKMAAGYNHPIAQYNLAARYLMQKRLKDAMTWALKAKENKHSKADRLIEEIKQKMK